MPPQLTNVTSETEVDAAGRGLNLSIVSAKDAMDAALAARLKATAAALDDALPERNAAVATRSGRGLLGRAWRAFQERRQRQSLRANLQDLSDRELMDIGLTRGEIDYITAERAIDRLRDSTIYLWGRGLM
ncbi:DUF1127 domain-containing protein [Bradyrhizobium sp. 149]|uniref:DUF1127 domain-containing protein n=1 Tax=Bradyrhizobium sp. 149 TaxID=2782624 RepID=UPI001FFC1F1D|nr:DUF1127 domain-containing protein [Bradyrhizobium sp. 149]MCK1652640.1 DUF1127 domain-containing protein [Bradyrhizobium sp. 149]